jgi:hypothetical protein
MEAKRRLNGYQQNHASRFTCIEPARAWHDGGTAKAIHDLRSLSQQLIQVNRPHLQVRTVGSFQSDRELAVVELI